MNLVDFLEKDKEKNQEAVESTTFFRPSKLDSLIEEAKRLLDEEKERSEDIERYTDCYETVKDSWYGFRSLYCLLEHIVNAYETEDC